MSLEKINEYLDRPENKKLEEIMQVNTIDYYEKELAKAKLFSDQIELELEAKNEECIWLKQVLDSKTTVPMSENHKEHMNLAMKTFRFPDNALSEKNIIKIQYGDHTFYSWEAFNAYTEEGGKL